MVGNSLNNYYVDLHIHIGRTASGKPVKITASKKLTIGSVLRESLQRKGLHMVGVIDAHSPEVLEEIHELIVNGEAEELVGGGIRYRDQLTLICGTELEIYDENCKGPIHVLCFFPTLQTMEAFSNWCSERLKNITLSSQRIYATGFEVQQKVKSLSGLFIPAHVFTPFKSLYGKGVNISLTEVFDPTLIDAVELGLSSDTYMADPLIELNDYTFLTNSDAHSTEKIAREHQIMMLAEPTFYELSLALQEKDGRKVAKNIGMHPKLGKYYETVCEKCLSPVENGKCSQGCEKGIVRGVSDRIAQLIQLQKEWIGSAPIERRERPPYIHQVPLSFIPGCGPKTIDKLLNAFGTEMRVIHEVEYEALKEVVPEGIAQKIIDVRNGVLQIEQGGGGRYGRIK